MRRRQGARGARGPPLLCLRSTALSVGSEFLGGTAYPKRSEDVPRSRGRAERNERAGGHAPTAEARSAATSGAAEACLPASDLSSYSCTLTDISVYLCDSKPPAGGAGGGRAVWTVSPHATEEQRGEDGQARDRGAGGGEDNLDISISRWLVSVIISVLCRLVASSLAERLIRSAARMCRGAEDERSVMSERAGMLRPLKRGAQRQAGRRKHACPQATFPHIPAL